jgi:LL-diaminopimelate aminotransferase
MWSAQRLSQLPPYLFVEIDRKKRAAREAGRDVIDLGVGDPDRPTYPFIIERLTEAVRDPANHRYAQGIGSLEFRRTAAEYMQRRFGVRLDPQTEIIALIGTKEGLGHLPTAVVDPGDVVMVPDPGYPVYTSASIFAGARCHTMPLREETGWLPVLSDVPRDVRSRARLMFLNYPNNPTAASAPRTFYEEAVAFAREHRILIAHDAAYAELHFGSAPISILEIPDAKEVSIEFHSLSKTFNMTGWRVGFAAGNAEALAALAKVKSNVDSGVFGAVQEAGIAALRRSDGPEVRAQIDLYRRRRDVLVSGLREAGWRVTAPGGTFFVWARCPGNQDSMTTATRILDEADVVAVPGRGFGAGGEGYIRFALTVDEPRLAEAGKRMARLKW